MTDDYKSRKKAIVIYIKQKPRLVVQRSQNPEKPSSANVYNMEAERFLRTFFSGNERNFVFPNNHPK